MISLGGRVLKIVNKWYAKINESIVFFLNVQLTNGGTHGVSNHSQIKETKKKSPPCLLHFSTGDVVVTQQIQWCMQFDIPNI